MRFLSLLSLALVASAYATAPIQNLKNKVLNEAAVSESSQVLSTAELQTSAWLKHHPKPTDCAVRADKDKGFGATFDGSKAFHSCRANCCGTCFKDEFPDSAKYSPGSVVVHCYSDDELKLALDSQLKLEQAALASDKAINDQAKLDEKETKTEEQLTLKDIQQEEKLAKSDEADEAALRKEDAADNARLAQQEAAQEKAEADKLAKEEAADKARLKAELDALQKEEDNDKKLREADAKAVAAENKKYRTRDTAFRHKHATPKPR